MTDTTELYAKALKMGLADKTRRQEKHLNPYLPVLDELIEPYRVVTSRNLGETDIPVDHIVGTKTAGRTQAFAHNFMPILGEDSEFAMKWQRLAQAQMDEGIREAVTAYELFGRYFVEEGNKRVSVMKFFKNPSIRARVRQVILDTATIPHARVYKEYLSFFDKTGIADIIMEHAGAYPRLLQFMELDDKKGLDDQTKEDFLYLYHLFEKTLKTMNHSDISVGDAFLTYLESFGFQRDPIPTADQLAQELHMIIPDLDNRSVQKETPVVTHSSGSDHKRFLSLRTSPLRIAFIESASPVYSDWSAEHIEGREYLKEQLNHEIDIRTFENCNDPKEVEKALKEAAEWRAEVIFTTSPTMITQTNQFAARHPKIKVLNCSLNPRAVHFRTYYHREFEIQFLMGMLAGILSDSRHIGYIASYPIFGTIANINAFAIGVEMVDPKAKIYLDWSSTKEPVHTAYPTDVDMIYISGSEFDTRNMPGKKFGLYDVRKSQFNQMALVKINWGIFYTKIIRSILNNTWKNDEISNDSASINYWLGLSNGLLDVSFSSKTPPQTLRLLTFMKDSMADDQFFIFAGKIESQDGIIYTKDTPLPVNQAAVMDWLNENIVGYLPDPDDLTDEAAEVCRIYGVTKDQDEDHE